MNDEDTIDLGQFNFKLAFSAHSYEDPFIKYDDLSKVDWKIYITESNGVEEITAKEIGFHKCTPEDFAQFYEPRFPIKTRVEAFIENDNFFCMDDTDEEGNPI